MKTADLIKVIAQDAAAHRPSMTRRLILATVLGCATAALALVATIGVRPDIGAALGTWRFDAKLLTVALALSGAWFAVKYLSRPEAATAKAVQCMLAPLLVLAVAIGAELAMSPAPTWSGRAIGSNARLCLVAIIAFALAPLGLLLTAVREGAPRSPSLMGAATGLLAGCVGALFYAIHCPDDSPLFVALWYTPPVLLMAIVGAVLGRRVLRW